VSVNNIFSPEKTMPKPIICLAEWLCQALEAYESLFTTAQWRCLVTVVLGLVETEGRRTLKELSSQVADKIGDWNLSRFLREMTWSPRLLMASWYEQFVEQIEPVVQREKQQRQRALSAQRGRRIRAASVTGYLIIDDSTHEKPYAEAMGGLGTHWSGVAKETVQGHSMLAALYVLRGHRVPVSVQMYRQKVVCEQEGAPFVSKIDLAVGRLLAFEGPKGTHTHVLVDSWFMNKRVWRTARDRGFALSGGLKANRFIRQCLADGTKSWQALSNYAAQLAPEDFEPLHWPNQEGGRTVYGHRLHTRVRKLGPCQVLITRTDPADPQTTRYWCSNQTHLSPQALVEHLAVRWTIEAFFADMKELLGSDHYQVHSAQAILRFWTLAAFVFYLLDLRRLEVQHAELDAHITLGSIRRDFQAEHRRRLLRWLRQQALLEMDVEALYPKFVQAA
jgi:hypothetical protein